MSFWPSTTWRYPVGAVVYFDASWSATTSGASSRMREVITFARVENDPHAFEQTFQVSRRYTGVSARRATSSAMVPCPMRSERSPGPALFTARTWM